MKCKKIQNLLPLYIENDLSEKKVSQIKSHLNECPLCHEEYKKYKNSLVEIKKWIQSETLELEEKEWRNILNRALRNKNLKNKIFVSLSLKPVWAVALMLVLAVGLSIFVANPSLIKTEKSASMASDLKWEDSQKQVEFTLVSLEKDIKIKWIFNKDFQLEEEIK